MQHSLLRDEAKKANLNANYDFNVSLDAQIVQHFKHIFIMN